MMKNYMQFLDVFMETVHIHAYNFIGLVVIIILMKAYVQTWAYFPLAIAFYYVSMNYGQWSVRESIRRNQKVYDMSKSIEAEFTVKEDKNENKKNG